MRRNIAGRIFRPVTLGLFMAVCLIMPASLPAGAAPKSGAALVQDAPATPALPRNWRTTRDAFRREAAGQVDVKGLKGQRLSGSGQFSEPQLRVMREKLPARGVVIMDLRQESHGMVNGLAVSWYGDRNWANRGLGEARVRACEKRLLAGLMGAGTAAVTQVIKKTPQGGIGRGRVFEADVESVSTEAGLCERYGLGYFRLAVSDHLRPGGAEVDRFLDFYRGLPAGSWLHFHCRAGVGRTTTFMLMTDMLANAGKVSLADLGKRQYLLGGAELLNRPPDNWKRRPYLERAAFLRDFYEFAKAGARGSWRDWAKRHGK